MIFLQTKKRTVIAAAAIAAAVMAFVAACIIAASAAYFGVKSDDITGSRRSKQIVSARQMAIYLIYDILGLPLAEIGTYIGGRDHTTIGYARDKIDKMRRDDPIVERQIQDIRAKLGKA